MAAIQSPQAMAILSHYPGSLIMHLGQFWGLP